MSAQSDSLSSSVPHGSNKENLGLHANKQADQIPPPPFALKHAAVRVSLSSSSVSSDLSVPAEGCSHQAPASAALHAVSSRIDTAQQESKVLTQPPDGDRQPTVLQLLSQLDGIKWENVAKWAAKDSAEAAALCNKLTPIMAESVVSQMQLGEDAISRLEAQVAKKKLVSKTATARPGLGCVLYNSMVMSQPAM